MSDRSLVKVFGAGRRLQRVAAAAGVAVERHARTGEPMVVVPMLASAGVLSAQVMSTGAVSLAKIDSSYQRMRFDEFLALLVEAL